VTVVRLVAASVAACLLSCERVPATLAPPAATPSPGLCDRLFGFRFAERLALSVALIVGLTTLIVFADILLDVIGEVHTEADARRGSGWA